MLFLKQSTCENDYKSFGKPEVLLEFLFIISSSLYFNSQTMTAFKSQLAIGSSDPQV